MKTEIHRTHGRLYAIWRARLHDEMPAADPGANPWLWWVRDLDSRDMIVAGVATKREAMAELEGSKTDPRSEGECRAVTFLDLDIGDSFRVSPDYRRARWIKTAPAARKHANATGARTGFMTTFDAGDRVYRVVYGGPR